MQNPELAFQLREAIAYAERLEHALLAAARATSDSAVSDALGNYARDAESIKKRAANAGKFLRIA